ncbi:ABC-2 transporter permease [Ornithinibacillus halophilus]|uniref:ABC-2 family transporter protein n=1 Tax=Ornithinibacillus halophilus TaxID=930117 RepID=A0A1M5JTK6_9BACI|nr:ABC-2 transporter permease [Ornithinibacillus halophilus]SHG43313.1 ABC-2 family transporter protein [Ornithinibacillus halophilus]
MTSLLKKEFTLNPAYLYVFFIIIIPFIASFSPYTLSWIIIGFIIQGIYSDSANRINKYLVSIPVSKVQIVQARYLYLVILATSSILIYVIFLFLLGGPESPILKDVEIIPNEVLIILSLIYLTIAVTLPVYYFFQSFNKSFIGILGSLFTMAMVVGALSVSPVADWYTNNSFTSNILLLSACALLFLFFSYKLSVWIFSRRDIL